MIVLGSGRSLSEIGIHEIPLGFCPPDYESGWTFFQSDWEPGTKYSVSLSSQRCNCPDFSSRADRNLNHLSRLCKHLMRSLDVAGAFQNSNEWIKLIASFGRRGPIGAYEIRTPNTREGLLVVRDTQGWVDFYARSTLKGEDALSASGPYHEYGWSYLGKRWRHGEYPRGGPHFRKVLERIEDIEPYEVSRDSN